MTGRTSKNVLDAEATDLLTEGRREGKLRSLAAYNIVLTGTMSLSRQDMTALITALGGRVQTSVSANTNVLIAADIHSASSKLKDAQRYSVPVMDEEGFAAWIAVTE